MIANDTNEGKTPPATTEDLSTDIPIHSAANLFPMMGDVEFRELVADIEANGIQTTIKLIGESRDTAKLIDGRNRLKAIKQLGLDPMDYADVIHPDDLGNPVQYVLSLNLHRRHLNESQRAMVASKVATLKQGDNQHTAIAASSQAAVAEILHVSADSIQRAKKVQERAVPAIVEAVESGKVSVSAAAVVASMPVDEQELLASQGAKAIVQAAKATKKPKLDTSVDGGRINRPVESHPLRSPISELRALFDEVDLPDQQAIDRLACWVIGQTDLTIITTGCRTWLTWGLEGTK